MTQLPISGGESGVGARRDSEREAVQLECGRDEHLDEGRGGLAQVLGDVDARDDHGVLEGDALAVLGEFVGEGLLDQLQFVAVDAPGTEWRG